MFILFFVYRIIFFFYRYWEALSRWDTALELTPNSAILHEMKSQVRVSEILCMKFTAILTIILAKFFLKNIFKEIERVKQKKRGEREYVHFSMFCCNKHVIYYIVPNMLCSVRD